MDEIYTRYDAGIIDKEEVSKGIKDLDRGMFSSYPGRFWYGWNRNAQR